MPNHITDHRVTVVQPDAAELDKLNHWIYCHYCDTMQEMRFVDVKAFPSGEKYRWRCPCGRHIHIKRLHPDERA